MDELKKVIMIVDDERGMRDMLRWSLGESGYEVRTARDGQEAVELLATGDVDLVISDLTMPRLDGFQLLEAAARQPTKPPVIIITGFGTVEMAVHAMRLGAQDFILKPFDLGALIDRIRCCVGSRATSIPNERAG